MGLPLTATVVVVVAVVRLASTVVVHLRQLRLALLMAASVAVAQATAQRPAQTRRLQVSQAALVASLVLAVGLARVARRSPQIQTVYLAHRQAHLVVVAVLALATIPPRRAPSQAVRVVRVPSGPLYTALVVVVAQVVTQDSTRQNQSAAQQEITAVAAAARRITGRAVIRLAAQALRASSSSLGPRLRAPHPPPPSTTLAQAL